MTDRPMLFLEPMVRALHAGRKTMTRRPLSKANTWFNGSAWPRGLAFEECDWGAAWVDGGPSPAGNPGPYLHVPWPYGRKFDNSDEILSARIYPRIQPGDRLWVRESGIQLGNAVASGQDHDDYEVCGFRYAADDTTIYLPGMFEGHDYERRRNSIHMPRWASRLTLTVTDVRVQRLQDISEEDAVAEGLIKLKASGRYVIAQGEQYFGLADHDPRKVYARLWNNINGPSSWNENPWVMAVSFTVQHGNIDSLPKVAA